MPFDNLDEFESWLKTQPHEVGIAVAARVTLRRGPDRLSSAYEAQLFDVILHNLRIFSINRAAFPTLTPEIKAAAEIADTHGKSLRSKTNKMTNAGASPVTFSRYLKTLALQGETSLAVLKDDVIVEHNNPFSVDLWHGETPPQEFTTSWEEVKAFMEPNTPWDFWRRWLEGFYGPNPRETIPFDVQKQIALLPNEDWDQGAEHIAAKIKEIERAYEDRQKLKKLKPAGELKWESTTEKFAYVPVEPKNSSVLTAALKALDKALGKAVNAQGNGCLREADYIAISMREALDDYKRDDDPLTLHMALETCSALLIQKMDDTSGELAQNDENRALSSALQRAEQQLRADNPVLQASYENRKQLQLEDSPEDHKAFIRDIAVPIFNEIADDTLRSLKNNAEAITRGNTTININAESGSSIFIGDKNTAYHASTSAVGMVDEIAKKSNILTRIEQNPIVQALLSAHNIATAAAFFEKLLFVVKEAWSLVPPDLMITISNLASSSPV